jgi:two-component system nitrogen regulation response regulator GlnG
MPFDLQTRLLRVLSDGHFYRVGGHNAIKTNVRVIAATHQDLEQRVKEGGFREDLFHRLNVIRLRLPALRQRREDIPMLTRHFLQQSAKQLGVDPKRITDGALAQLAGFSFPGNVRQLENICHWLTVMAPSQVIETKDLPPEVLEANPVSSVPAAAIPAVEPVTVSATAHTPAGHAQQSVAHDVPMPVDAAPVNGHTAASSAALGDSSATAGASWELTLDKEVQAMLASGSPDVWDEMSRRFESRLITAALACTKGRRIDAAHKLGIGRNTITRKIQELGLDTE